MKKSLIALSLGTLGLGIAEFVMMGILPDVAKALQIDISTAGHFISAYALGVCLGAPILLFARKMPPKRILEGLVCLMFAGNLCAFLSPGYYSLLFSRLLSGLLHGAYFGVASIVASKLASQGKSAEAVSIMIAGMTIANLFGVPLGTSLSHNLSWRLPFLLVSGWSLIVFYGIWKWVPAIEGVEDTGFKGQFRFLKRPEPWLILGATALGNGGAFCWYSYISPLLTQVSGFRSVSLSFLMILAGFGMVAGNIASGRLSDRFGAAKMGTVFQALIGVVSLCLFFFSPYALPAVLLMCLGTAGLFAVSAPEQLLIIKVAKGGEMLGAASVQMAFNLGNAIGAYAGGLVVNADLRYPALMALPFCLAGFSCFLLFYKKYSRNYG